jgi:NAD(P)-dependent dehydrogenase (short-subunit alcohol dehydrogenase family)
MKNDGRHSSGSAEPLPRPVAVVTGGSAGVGRATVRRLASLQFDVAVLARESEGLSAACAEVEAAGGRALAIPVDVADAGAVQAASDRIEAELGPIDVWINDAMTSVFAPFDAMTAAEFERVTQVTYLGVVHGTRAALAHMKKRGRGKIVQVGSALAYRSIPLQSAYCGAKSAIRGFTDSLRCELIHDGSAVEITMVQLPALNTPQFDWVRNRLPRQPQPVPPIYQPEVAAEAIVWAATHARRELYVGWSTVVAIVFAAKLFPSIGDAYLAWRGYGAQQTRAPCLERPDNLFQSVQGAHHAHGAFDRRARRASLESLATRHRGAVATAGLALCALAGLFALRLAAR